MHIHSRRSPDGLMRAAGILERARRAGLGGLCVSDHNTLAGSLDALELAPPDLLIIPGAEYSTDLGHMLAYFIARDAKAEGVARDRRGRFDFTELLAFVKEQGGFLFAAHPYRRPSGDLSGVLDSLSGVEVYNSRNIWRDRPANRRALELCTSLHLPFCAGSDAHLPLEVGRAYRIFQGDSIEQIKQELKTPGGEFFGRVSPLSAQCASSLCGDVRVFDIGKTARSAAKLGFSVLYDASTGFDRDRMKEADGAVYRVENEEQG